MGVSAAFSADSLGVAPVDAHGLRALDGQARQTRTAHRQGRHLHPDGGIRRRGGLRAGTFSAPSSPDIPDICRKACSARLRAANSEPSCAGKKTPCKFSSAAPMPSCSITFTATACSPATGWSASPARCRKPPAICPKAAACGFSKSAQARPVSRRNCCRCSSAGSTPTPSPTFPPASSRRRTRNSRPSPRWNTRCWILRSLRPDQDFEPGTYDFIVGTNVLHAVADVRVTLKMLHELLVPGGTLMFMDVATPQLWIESVFGLMQGWWHLTDRDLRPDQPLMQRAQWESALKQAGFAETASMPGLNGPGRRRHKSASSAGKVARAVAAIARTGRSARSLLGRLRRRGRTRKRSRRASHRRRIALPHRAPGREVRPHGCGHLHHPRPRAGRLETAFRRLARRRTAGSLRLSLDAR